MFETHFIYSKLLPVLRMKKNRMNLELPWKKNPHRTFYPDFLNNMCMNRYFGHFLGDGGKGGKRKVKSNLGIKKGYLVKMEKLRIFWHF